MKDLLVGVIFASYILCINCEGDYDNFIKANSNNLLTLSASATSLPADGESVIDIEAILNGDYDHKTIEFKTTHGTFLPSNLQTVSIPASWHKNILTANVKLLSTLVPKDGIEISATIMDFSDSIHIRMVNAFPDTIIIESSFDTLKSYYSSELPLVVHLARNIGMPSLGQYVKFYALTTDNDSIGEFRSIPLGGSDSMGVITSTFQLRDTSYLGLISIFCSVKGENQSYVDKYDILVTK